MGWASQVTTYSLSNWESEGIGLAVASSKFVFEVSDFGIQFLHY